jgi:hypothetical protein
MGLGLGKDMFGFQARLFEAGLSFEEYKKATQSLSAGIAGLSGGMNASMSTYLKSVQEFKGSDLGDAARRLGFEFEEMGEIVAFSTDRRIRQDKEVSKGHTELMIRASELASTVAANTEVFGISRTAQLEALKKQQEDAAVQRQMTAEQKKVYDSMFLSLEAMGLGKYGNLAVKQQGRFTQDQQVEMTMAMGAQNSREFQMAVKESMAAAKDGDKDRITAANQRMLEIQNRIIQDTQLESNKNRASMAQFYDGSIKTGIEQSNIITQLSGPIIEAQKRGQSLPEAIAAALAEAKKPSGLGAEGGKPGEKATDAVLLLERTVRDTGATLGLAIETGAKKASDILSSKLGIDLARQFQNSYANDPEGGKFTSGKGGFTPQMLTDALTMVKEGKGMEEVIKKLGTQFKDVIKESWDYIKSMAVQRAGGSPGINDFLGGGNLSGMFENFGSGTSAILHGNEAVFRPEQLANVIAKVQSNTQGLLSNVQNQFTPEKITNLINTAISSSSNSLPNTTTDAANGQMQLSNTTLDEIKTQLTTLNTIMDSHLRNISSTADKQYSALKSLNPDLHS